MSMRILPFILLLASCPAFAMPCDTGYVCRSKHYEIEINTCRYKNAVRLLSVFIHGEKVEGAELGPAYDGTYANDTSAGSGPLAFEVTLPLTKEQRESGVSKVLTVEVRGARRQLQGKVFSKIVEASTHGELSPL